MKWLSLLVFCFWSSPTVTLAQATKIEIGLTSASASNAPHYVALEKGFYKAEKLDVSTVFAGSAVNVIQQLAARSLNLGWAATDQAIRAITRGAPIKIVAGAGAAPAFRIVGAKDLNGWSGIKGKRVSVGGPSDQTLYFFRVIARNNGLSDRDYDLVYAGSTADRFSHLLSGTVAATVLTNPLDFTAVDQGYQDLGVVSTTFRNWTQNNIEVNTTWAQTHRQQVVAFLRAHIRAIRYFYDPLNKDEVITIIQKYTKDNMKNTGLTYDYYVSEGVIAREAALSKPGLEAVIGALRELGDLKAAVAVDALVDPTFLAEAQR